MKKVMVLWCLLSAGLAFGQAPAMKKFSTMVGGDYVAITNPVAVMSNHLGAVVHLSQAQFNQITNTCAVASNLVVEVGVHTNRTDNPHEVTAAQVGALTVETDPLFGFWLGSNTYVKAEQDAAALAKLTVHTNRTDNPHEVTAAQIGALTPAYTNGWTVSTHDNLATVASLYTLMATSRIDRVWENANTWWTFETNILRRNIVTSEYKWNVNLRYDVYDAEFGGNLVCAATNFISDAPFPLVEGGAWTGLTINGSGTDVAAYTPVTLSWFTIINLPQSSDFEIPQTDGYPPGNELRYTPVLITSTNSVVYYLFTNQIPPETWSRTDMSSWISTNQYVGVTATNVFNDLIAGACDVGGIVFSTAFDAANTTMNNHLAADNPHFSVKRLNGVATNLTIIGGNVNGDTLIGAVGVSNAIAAAQKVISTRFAVSNVSDVAGYLVLTNTPSTNAVKQLVVNNPDLDSYVFQAISEPFGSTYTLPGNSKVTCRAYATVSAGSATLQAHFYITDAAGTTVHEWDAGNSVPLPGTLGDGEWFEIAHADSFEVQPTQRRALKFKIVAKTGAPVITFYLENGRQMTVDLPVPSSYFVSQSELTRYVPTNTVNLVNTTLKDGALNGTNGVYFTRLGTNHWILLY